MFQRYEAQGYPGEFPLRSKCVALFQKIHGVDTLLFAMYVYEYGHDSPAPNKRRVYISYLDSVQYFEPKCYRTTAYHAIIIEYLGYVKRRGFHTAAIWSCPPVGGDDYVFYCHPKHQLVPREDMLRSWYHKMLDQAKLQGIVIRTTTLHDEYFASDSVDSVRGEKRDLTCLPYFDGDYLPGEIENIIQQLECAGNSRIATTQDNVMVRVGHNLRKMKDNFIVVHLRNRRFAAAVERGEDVSNWKEDSDDDMLRSKRAKISGKCSAELDAPIKNLPSESVASLESMTMDDRSVISSGGDISTATPLNDGISIKKDSIKVSRELKGTGIISKDEISMSAQAKSEAVARDDADVCQFKVAGDARMSLPVSGNVAKKEPPVFELTKGHKSERLERFDDLSRLDIVDNFAVSSGNNLDTTVGLRRESARTGIEDEPSPSTGNQNSKIVSSVGLECGTVSVGDDKAGSCSRDGVAVDPLNRDCVEQAAVRGIEGERLGQVTSYPTVASVVNTDASEADNMVAHIDCVEARDRWDAKFAIKKENTSLFPTESDKVLPGVAGSEIEIAPSSKSIDAERDSNKSSQDDSGDVDELQALKRALEVIKPAVSLHFSGLNRPAAQVGDTVDEDPPMESEIFESRQQFLNYCQTTHCQFDELRRAKHSTMMLLFQLHNPMAPKFLQQCGACYRDITHGFRYHCKVCSNFDLCEECYEPVTSGVWAKRDPRFAHEKTHSFTPINTEVLEETQKSRAERQKSLKAHIELLEHAGTCLGPPGCSLHNCERMKKLFLHVPSCDVQPKKECKICTRLLALCTMHSRLCAARGPCPIPFCDRIRERNRRLRRQQKLMDDRRRQAQNELYHAGGEA